MEKGYGSSPHTRGTHQSSRPGDGQCRFIPAYAGNALQARYSDALRPVHPRIRGERVHGRDAAAVAGGSSPHTRGTLTGPRPEPPLPRFIPAYAGNARWLACSKVDRYGSSPHTRGTRSGFPGPRRPARFIPAYAGNAGDLQALAKILAVHPRIRGERTRLVPPIGETLGSSPHTRGTLLNAGNPHGYWRFIPAYAGNACVVG